MVINTPFVSRYYINNTFFFINYMKAGYVAFYLIEKFTAIPMSKLLCRFRVYFGHFRAKSSIFSVNCDTKTALDQSKHVF